jgi:uncharacterized membrane protein
MLSPKLLPRSWRPVAVVIGLIITVGVGTTNFGSWIRAQAESSPKLIRMVERQESIDERLKEIKESQEEMRRDIKELLRRQR